MIADLDGKRVKKCYKTRKFEVKRAEIPENLRTGGTGRGRLEIAERS